MWWYSITIFWYVTWINCRSTYSFLVLYLYLLFNQIIYTLLFKQHSPVLHSNIFLYYQIYNVPFFWLFCLSCLFFLFSSFNVFLSFIGGLNIIKFEIKIYCWFCIKIRFFITIKFAVLTSITFFCNFTCLYNVN